jgi:hypothetical protein
MHTYSHAVFTWALARYLKPKESNAALWGAVGAALPDMPTLVKAARFVWRRRDAIAKEEFKEEFLEALDYFEEPSGRVDLTLHSLMPVGSLLALYKVLGLKERDPDGALLAFLLGWAGHNLLDLPTHAEDARPPFWPFSRWRFKSPVSYWDREFYALPCLFVEHGAILALILMYLQQAYQNPDGDQLPAGEG